MRSVDIGLVSLIGINLLSHCAAASDLSGPVRRVLQTTSFLSSQPQANVGGQNALLNQAGGHYAYSWSKACLRDHPLGHQNGCQLNLSSVHLAGWAPPQGDSLKNVPSAAGQGLQSQAGLGNSYTAGIQMLPASNSNLNVPAPQGNGQTCNPWTRNSTLNGCVIPQV